MANVQNYIVISVFAVIVLYYMFSTAYTIASPVTSQSIANMLNNTYNDTTLPVVKVNSVSNATYTFPSTHYSATGSTIKLITNGTEANGTYTVNYDGEASATVFGLDMAWVGALVIVGAGIAVVIKMIV